MRNTIRAHPITSTAITVLILAAICGTLITPIYARATPKAGAFPFFYLYLLIYMPALAVVLWIVYLLQKRISR
jgi:hypothetical protein